MHLPNDIYTIIIKFCTINTLQKLYCVNKYLHSIIEPYAKFFKNAHKIQLKNRRNKDKLCKNKLFNRSIIYGDLKICKLIYREQNIDIHCDNELALKLSCKHNHIDIAKWLYSINAKIISGNHPIYDNIFYKCCKYGEENYSKWLYSLDAIKNIASRNLDYYFYIACEWDNIKMAKWLYSIGANVNYDDYRPFIVACRNHYIELAKWIYSVNNNVHINNALYQSCVCGSLKIAEWLYSIGARLHDKNAPFFSINIGGYSHIANWLCSIDKNYRRIEIDDQIIVHYVRDKN